MGEKVLMKGNEAIAEAAIRAGCMHYFGYPITPQTEIAAYMAKKTENESLEEYLNAHVFADARGTTLAPDQADVDGFNTYIEQYKQLLEVERKAVETI